MEPAVMFRLHVGYSERYHYDLRNDILYADVDFSNFQDTALFTNRQRILQTLRMADFLEEKIFPKHEERRDDASVRGSLAAVTHHYWNFLVRIVQGFSSYDVAKDEVAFLESKGYHTTHAVGILKGVFERDYKEAKFLFFDDQLVQFSPEGSLEFISEDVLRIPSRIWVSATIMKERNPLAPRPIPNKRWPYEIADHVVPRLKRKFDTLQEETEKLEAEYSIRKREANANLTKMIQEYAQKKSAAEAKLNELNKVLGEDII